MGTRSIHGARVVLASASPRRAELLRQVGIPFLIDPSGVSEVGEPDWSPGQLAQELALRKAADVALRHPEADLVLGADTVVVRDTEALGKPLDAAEATRMLMRLSGREHQVITGWAIVTPRGGSPLASHSVSRVFFDDLDMKTIERYVASGEPMDKAGAYAIQGMAGCFVRAIEGEYANIVGLPIAAIGRALRQFGWHVI